MKTFIALIAATTLSSVAVAAPNDAFVNNEDSYGSVLLDVDNSTPSAADYAPTGHLVGVIASNSNYGSVLFDLDQASPRATLSSQPSIGDDADDYGNVLYDNGAVY